MDQADNKQPRWWSRATLIGGIIALALLVVGPLGTRFGIWGFQFGLMCLFGAVVLAAIGLIVAIFGYLVARRNSYDVDRPVLVTGGVIAALILAVMGVQANAAFSVPAIHNISTDVDDPPVFQQAGALRGVDSNPLDYDAETLAPLQQAAYPDVQPLDSSLSPSDAFARAKTVLEDMGLEIIGQGRTAAASRRRTPLSGLASRMMWLFAFGRQPAAAASMCVRSLGLGRATLAQTRGAFCVFSKGLRARKRHVRGA